MLKSVHFLLTSVKQGTVERQPIERQQANYRITHLLVFFNYFHLYDPVSLIASFALNKVLLKIIMWKILLSSRIMLAASKGQK